METIGLGAGSYPEPKEERVKTIEGKIWICYEFETEVPEKWDEDQIKEDIKENLKEYQQEISEVEIDI